LIFVFVFYHAPETTKHEFYEYSWGGLNGGRDTIVWSLILMYRLSLESIGHVRDKSVQGGEKAVANCDEDSLTMSADATSDCDGRNCL
jgi:hypothetical protein